jgi:hypothetical protein
MNRSGVALLVNVLHGLINSDRVVDKIIQGVKAHGETSSWTSATKNVRNQRAGGLKT